MIVRMEVFFREVVDHIGGLGSGEERDERAVAEEAEVAEVGHQVDGISPGQGVGGGTAGAGVVDGRDVDASEAEAGTGAEHLAVGVGVCGLEELFGAVDEGWCSEGGVPAEVWFLEGGVRGREEVRGGGEGVERCAFNGAGVGVMLACKTPFGPESHAFPDVGFGVGEVGEAFADSRDLGESCDVGDGEGGEDLDEEFLGQLGDGAFLWWRGVGGWGSGFDAEGVEGRDEGGCAVVPTAM